MGSRRLELVPVEVKALLGTTAVWRRRASTMPSGARGRCGRPRPAHFGLPKSGVAVTESQVQGVEEDLGYRLPGPYRSFLKAAGGCAPVGAALDAELGLLVDQPFFTVRDEAAVNDLVYVNKCLRDHLTKDYFWGSPSCRAGCWR
ncbi:Knr4/Smi1-like domain-containing protein OS=Streptomyces violarus OX=67380 GN=FHS41_006827 PE=4 SV=1 [Streptomyces violarus]